MCVVYRLARKYRRIASCRTGCMQSSLPCEINAFVLRQSYATLASTHRKKEQIMGEFDVIAGTMRVTATLGRSGNNTSL